jgi:hypothetical protein
MDQNAQQQCDTQIKEAQRYIDYFTGELVKLQQKINRSSIHSGMASPLQTPSSDISITTGGVGAPSPSSDSFANNTDLPLQEPQKWLTLADDTAAASPSTCSPLTPSPLVTQSPGPLCNLPSNDTFGGETSNVGNINLTTTNTANTTTTSDSPETETVLLDSSISVNNKFHMKKKYTNLGKKVIGFWVCRGWSVQEEWFEITVTLTNDWFFLRSTQSRYAYQPCKGVTQTT